MTPQEERALDLMAESATQGLGKRRARELDGLLESFPKPTSDRAMMFDRESFDLAAAAVELAYTDVEPMPAALRRRVVRQAAEVFDFPADAPGSREPSKVVRFPAPKDETPTGPSPWLGWMAAAAALVLAVLGWLPEADRRIAERPPATSPAEARSELLARAQDVVRVEWTATEDPAAAEASGDVVWSDARQEGYLRLRGLPVNDPDAWQYQLWIFDPERDERYPIDGGVFDVPRTGEVVVPIDPKLEVTHASLFAVTIEKPGGVVVSSRERLPLLAEVG